MAPRIARIYLFPMRPLLLAGLVAAASAVLMGACGSPSQNPGQPPASGPVPLGDASAAGPEATSLLGEPLYRPASDPATAARLNARLDSAMAAHRAAPEDPDALIWLGRHLAYVGRYRDAVVAFTHGVQLHPDDARMYRHRGHRYITLREFDLAAADLERAASLVSGLDDEVEPDGQPNPTGIPVSTLHTNIWYHLGLARYLQNDPDGASHAFRTGLQISPNYDMRVAMADWLWHAYTRAGHEPRAAELLATIPPAMDLIENHAYHRRLLLYKGELSIHDLMPRDDDAAASPLSVATYGYGLGAWYLAQGDTTRAVETFRGVLDTGFWPAFGFIAAEADLARILHDSNAHPRGPD
jgi:tetratricopeptide (TPR) repeat protein